MFYKFRGHFLLANLRLFQVFTSERVDFVVDMVAVVAYLDTFVQVADFEMSKGGAGSEMARGVIFEGELYIVGI